MHIGSESQAEEMAREKRIKQAVEFWAWRPNQHFHERNTTKMGKGAGMNKVVEVRSQKGQSLIQKAHDSSLELGAVCHVPAVCPHCGKELKKASKSDVQKRSPVTSDQLKKSVGNAQAATASLKQARIAHTETNAQVAPTPLERIEKTLNSHLDGTLKTGLLPTIKDDNELVKGPGEVGIASATFEGQQVLKAGSMFNRKDAKNGKS